MGWLWFILGMLAGAALLAFIVGFFMVGARNDDSEQSVPNGKREKRRLH